MKGVITKIIFELSLLRNDNVWEFCTNEVVEAASIISNLESVGKRYCQLNVKSRRVLKNKFISAHRL